MELLKELEALGADTDEGLDRIMGDEDLYVMMLGMFVEMVRERPILPEEFAGSDLNSLISQVHTLKGTAGNLSLTPLFEGYVKTLELLRSDRPGEARQVFEKMLPLQTEMIACIERHSAG